MSLIMSLYSPGLEGQESRELQQRLDLLNRMMINQEFNAPKKNLIGSSKHHSKFNKQKETAYHNGRPHQQPKNTKLMRGEKQDHQRFDTSEYFSSPNREANSSQVHNGLPLICQS